jgi:hypothetical protein
MSAVLAMPVSKGSISRPQPLMQMQVKGFYSVTTWRQSCSASRLQPLVAPGQRYRQACCQRLHCGTTMLVLQPPL